MSSIRRAPVLRGTSLEGAPAAANNFGNKIVHRDFASKALCYGPSWNSTETVIRPYPSLSYDNPNELEPYRLDVRGSARFGNWIRRYDVAWRVGKGQNKRTFLMYDFNNSRPFDLNSTPLNILCAKVTEAKKNASLIREHPTFPLLFERDATGGNPLTWPKSVFLIQGALFVHNSKLKYGLNDKNEVRAPLGIGKEPSCIFAIPGGSPKTSSSNAAGKLLLNLLNEENDSYDDPSDFEARYKYGDPVSPDSGRFFVFKEAGTIVSQSFLMRDQEKRMMGGGGFRNSMQFQSANNRGGKVDFKGYDVEVVDIPLVDGTTPVMNDQETIADIKSHWMYWEEVLWFPTLTEQARELNEVFDPDEIVFAFSGCDPDWITDETWRKYRGTTSAQANTPPSVMADFRRSTPAVMDDPFGYPPGEEPADSRVVPNSGPVAVPASANRLDSLRADKPQVFSGGKIRNADVIAPSSIPAVQNKEAVVDNDDSEANSSITGQSAIDNLMRLRNQKRR